MNRIHSPSFFLGIGVGITGLALFGFAWFQLFIAPQLLSSESIALSQSIAVGSQQNINENLALQADGSWRVTIRSGTKMAEFAQMIAGSGIIDSPLELEILAVQSDMADSISPGVYSIGANAEPRDIIESLLLGPID